jgi:hypothetical protein
MALQSSIGPRTGPVDAMSVVITVWDDAAAEITESQAVERAQLDAPIDFFGINQDTNPSVDQLAPYAYDVTINYRYRQLANLRKPLPQETDTVRRRGGPFAVEPKDMLTYLQPIGVYDSTGDVTDQHASTKWLINQVSPGFDYKEPGARISPLAPRRFLEYTAPAGLIDDDYIDGIEEMMEAGAFNDSSYLGRPAYTLQLVYFDFADRSPDDSILTYGFGYRAVKEDFQATSDIVIPTLRPTDYHYFGANRDGFDPTTGAFQRIPRLVYVGQVWPTADYATILNLPDG